MAIRVTLADLGYAMPEWGDSRLKADVWRRIRVEDNGCWTWTGGRDADNYGRYRHGKAHLNIFRALCGPTPEDLITDHLCHDPLTCRGGVACPHRPCVNPGDLAWVTYAKNAAIDRRNRWGRLPDESPALDVCKWNHEFTPANTLWNLSRGVWVRRCKACAREVSRRHMATKRGGDPGEFAPRLDHEPRKTWALAPACPQGHGYTEENTYLRPDGKGRDCRACRTAANARSAAWKKARRAVS